MKITAMASAPHRVSGRTHCGQQEQFYLEGQITYAVPREDGQLTLYVSTQHPDGNQREAAALTVLAELLGGNGQTSVLARALQFDTQVAVYSSAFYDGTSIDDATFGLAVTPAQGVSLASPACNMLMMSARSASGATTSTCGTCRRMSIASSRGSA